MNLAGSELPLENIDTFAKKLGDSNETFSIFSSFLPTLFEDRLEYTIEICGYHCYKKTNNLKGPVPYNMTVFKGYKGVILSKEFAKFVITHPVPQALREWLKDVQIPDEEFFSTLARITEINHDEKSDTYSVVQNKNNLDNQRLYVKDGLCPRYKLSSVNL